MKKLGGFEELKRGVQDHRSIREIEPLSAGLWLKLLRSGTWYKERRILFQRFVKTPLKYNWEVPAWNDYLEYYKFTIIRNPWARVYSWYKNVMRDPIKQINNDVDPDCDFNEFVCHHLDQWALRSQLWWLKDWSGKIPLDYIGRFENLEEDFHQISLQLGIKDPSLPRLVVGETEHYSRVYTPDLIDIVAEKYQEEIGMFNFKFSQ